MYPLSLSVSKTPNISSKFVILHILFAHSLYFAVSIGTGGFAEERFSPKFGWDAIIGQIVNSACDGERIHHVLEDVVGEGGKNGKGMKYYRFNPLIGTSNSFPIDTKDPAVLASLYEITSDYLKEPEQVRKLRDIRNILNGKRGWKKLLPW
jgi:hypothetical protein